VADQAPPDLRAQLITVQETARTSLDDVRRIARRLRPGVLDDLGLLSALSELASEVERLGAIPIRRRIVHPLPGLSPDVELVLYRIAQESLTNVVRHARASTATLSLDLGHDDALGDVLRMVVTDDGVGVADSSEGAGLLGMRERALLVGGTLEIGSPATGGTAVALSIPVHAPDGAGAP
jgi:two-component system sensor histidine kinase UhpB